MSLLLQVEGLEAFHGVSQALFGVDLAVGEGEVVALMGRNGMGKTTTIRSVFGLTRTRAKTLRFAGEDLVGVAPHRVARMGIGLVPEGRRCFATLTVAENLLAAARSGAWTLPRVYALFPRLEERQKQSAKTLSGGEQQMLAIGRALMTNPRLLVLDEATEGLAPVIRADIWSAIRSLKAEGQSILLVDKTLRELLPVADSCVVLENGRSAWSGRPDDLTAAIRDRYLGV
ncbi:ABC transporter ATP-binding protein [Tianweitania sediminis]|jgi:branched-chain amino acid transport system ATP-binding protein|uniref:ABC transporter ATP-binding protein n=1 Tax=Tianweitania sediminis TaxID=1502156 RepID=A0A8J7QYL0_9HYPH|nr:ABC transporter ATP-binding protein [Tianweitania sediminis]MBP0438350.1 ABC transporter ATP-binding protein [Tianweitania sediminis]HEV7416734.1 ABC transporter ATP-binding protein [Tianweitania sediminis]